MSKPFNKDGRRSLMFEWRRYVWIQKETDRALSSNFVCTAPAFGVNAIPYGNYPFAFSNLHSYDGRQVGDLEDRHNMLRPNHVVACDE